MLGALGLEPADEAIYRLLVTNAGLTMADLAGLTDRASGDLDGVLSRLVAQGLVARTPAIETPGVVPQFRAAPPAVALGGLLRQRRDDLHVAEQDLATLVEEHRLATAGASTSGVVEEITDITAVRQRFSQIQEAAQFEVLSMVIPNLTVVPHRQNTSGSSGVRRGVRYRAILDRAALTVPGMLADVVASIECGQEIRIADHVAVKMMIVDRQCAMLPLLHAQHTAPESVLVSSSGLLDALIAYFEMAWDRAYPFLAQTDAAREREIDELDSQILALLLSGMTDQAVAGQLRMSRRTVQRRIHELMVKAAVETRIELGWHAARKGWA